ncbi:MAG TPA: hypothetical protein VEO53_09880, partial [Candidatus Binatia bacterium]|nr:hypothetical protein [Candidatus Binatia bacterium]
EEAGASKQDESFMREFHNEHSVLLSIQNPVFSIQNPPRPPFWLLNSGYWILFFSRFSFFPFALFL